MESFEHALTTLINQFSQENGCNTPDFILAKYMLGCLQAYNETVKSRDLWYFGKIVGPGTSVGKCAGKNELTEGNGDEKSNLFQNNG